jgi:DNA replication initiation complex subunit (GINS family)
MAISPSEAELRKKLEEHNRSVWPNVIELYDRLSVMKNGLRQDHPQRYQKYVRAGHKHAESVANTRVERLENFEKFVAEGNLEAASTTLERLVETDVRLRETLKQRIRDALEELKTTRGKP